MSLLKAKAPTTLGHSLINPHLTPTHVHRNTSFHVSEPDLSKVKALIIPILLQE